MKKTYNATVIKATTNNDEKCKLYVLEYEDEGKVYQTVCEEETDSIPEPGDVVIITIENGDVVQTNIRELTKNKNQNSITHLYFAAVISIIMFIFFLLINVDSFPFRVFLILLIAAFILLMNLL